jgi:predicted O-linked N-acetylglucosamine transferase (SPINDLY family)
VAILQDSHKKATGGGTGLVRDGRLRVGFLSYFFYHHSVGLLMQGVIKNLDPEKFHKTLIYPNDMPKDYLSKVVTLHAPLKI